jgi:hypothetical protein
MEFHGGNGNAVRSNEGVSYAEPRYSGARRDFLVIAAGAVAVFAVSSAFDLFDKVIGWIYRHDTWQLDELFTVAIYLVFAMGAYGWRRHYELQEQVLRRERAEAEKARLLPELESARADVAVLEKLIPVCSSCKRVRDDQGYWNRVEEYMKTSYHARFDTGMCPECARRIYSKAYPMR